MRRAILPVLLAVIVAAGCDPAKNGGLNQWESAPMTHICTEPQMGRVERETLFCKTQAGYAGVGCYGAAIMRNCRKRAPNDP
jgi:hypothetical protein